ncbi:hypothetical protein NEMBOFW57_002633 [Staphylotrichum longicolle]|uniref:RBR-type E3 ubiquitin transferase n=1 Tax=Staphylotrichum longicolle TaxID=669026 RepID=A0AAD4F8D4_9PEZI|nr:hypothetical protein NEMBOFW57_002633 [Staphylotrichum longicolle]
MATTTTTKLPGPLPPDILLDILTTSMTRPATCALALFCPGWTLCDHPDTNSNPNPDRARVRALEAVLRTTRVDTYTLPLSPSSGRGGQVATVFDHGRHDHGGHGTQQQGGGCGHGLCLPVLADPRLMMGEGGNGLGLFPGWLQRELVARWAARGVFVAEQRGKKEVVAGFAGGAAAEVAVGAAARDPIGVVLRTEKAVAMLPYEDDRATDLAVLPLNFGREAARDLMILADRLEDERRAQFLVRWEAMERLETLCLDLRGYRAPPHPFLAEEDVVQLARSLEGKGLELLVIAGLRSWACYPGPDELEIAEVEGGTWTHRSRHGLATLDLRYSKEFTVTVNDGPSLSSLERYIRDRYEQGGKPLEDAAVFQFFDSKGRELAPSAKITTDSATLWYRVARSRAHIGRWKLSHWEDRTDGALDDGNLAAKIISAIDAGATVRELKQAIAEHLNIRDWQQVLIVARDGMRRGTLQGNNWEVRQVKEWLCRWLAIDVNPHNGYAIFRGLGREYGWYPGAHRAGKSTPLVILWEYLLSRVFHNVHRYGRTKLKGGGGLELRLRGKVLDIWSDSVEWGATYDFELADGFAETFVAEEAWLTTITEQCSTCIEDKKPGEMATRITSSCRHKPSVCKDCLQSWLETSVESGKWEKPKCPDCSEVLEWQDVKRHASKETFARYDDLLLRGALTAEPNFQYCLSQTCNSGQIYEGKCPRFKCAACKKAYCVEHNVPWHANETCEQYDQRNDKHRKAERASEREVQTTTKACPSCGKRVFKHSGCNHMTCICGHEWCYRCLAPYAYTAHGFLFCRHTAECTENDPVVPALDALNEFAAMRAGPMRAGEQAAARALPPHPAAPFPALPPRPALTSLGTPP